MAILSSPSSPRNAKDPSSGRSSRPGGSTGWAKGEPGLIRSVLAHPLADSNLILGAAALLLVLGTMMVLSASSVTAFTQYDDPYYFVKRQVVFLIAGVAAATWLATRRVRTLRVLSWVGLGGVLLLLVLVFTPLGVEVNGNRNWLRLGHSLLQLQPSEFAKLAMVMWGADVLARKQRLLDQPRHLMFPYVLVAGLLIGLVLLQGDFGTAVVMGGIMVAVLWMIGAPLRLLAAFGLSAAALSVFMVVSSPSRMRRFLGFLDPTADTLSINMQPTMAVWALASGGWWGLGLGASRQKWGGLVEAHTDFVFAVIGEELGLLGTLAVLALFMTLIAAGLRVAMRSDDLYCRYAAAGVTAWFGLQAMINLCVVLRLLPVMGVPLPFVSYGGSALLANLAALGVLICCARNEPAARKALAKGKSAPKPKMTAVIGSRG